MQAYKNAIRGGERKEEAKEALKQRPLLVMFVLDGCPHCEKSEAAWEKAKKEADVPAIEIEASAAPEGEASSGFPTMKYVPKEGEEKEISGEKTSSEEILKELEVPKKSSGGRRRRRRSRRHVNRLGGRKTRHRTLRSYVAF